MLSERKNKGSRQTFSTAVQYVTVGLPFLVRNIFPSDFWSFPVLTLLVPMLARSVGNRIAAFVLESLCLVLHKLEHKMNIFIKGLARRRLFKCSGLPRLPGKLEYVVICPSCNRDPEAPRILPCRRRECLQMVRLHLWRQRKTRGHHPIAVWNTGMIPPRKNTVFKISGQTNYNFTKALH